MIVALMGYRGSGKTTVGRLLAERLRLPFMDLDEEIVRRAGRTIRDVFAAGGEPEFRRQETAALLDLLETPRLVLSLGGGAVLAEENRIALRRRATLRAYLSADAATLHDRIHADVRTSDNRPALTHLGGGVEEIRHLLSIREPIYGDLATLVLDATQPPDALAALITSSIEHRPSTIPPLP